MIDISKLSNEDLEKKIKQKEEENKKLRVELEKKKLLLAKLMLQNS